jgi:hypothetical protein
MKRRPDTQDGSTVHRGTSGILPRDEDPPRPTRYRREAVDQQHRDIIPGVAGRQYQRGDFPTMPPARDPATPRVASVPLALRRHQPQCSRGD